MNEARPSARILKGRSTARDAPASKDDAVPGKTAPFEKLIGSTSDIVGSYLARHSVEPGEVSPLIRDIFGALADAHKQASALQFPRNPAVPLHLSVRKRYIVCLEDGIKMKMLKRHLRTQHGLTPHAYRARWGLAGDYPMVAPDHAERRRKLAKAIGLGRKPGEPGGRPEKTG